MQDSTVFWVLSSRLFTKRFLKLFCSPICNIFIVKIISLQSIQFINNLNKFRAPILCTCYMFYLLQDFILSYMNLQHFFNPTVKYLLFFLVSYNDFSLPGRSHEVNSYPMALPFHKKGFLSGLKFCSSCKQNVLRCWISQKWKPSNFLMLFQVLK